MRKIQWILAGLFLAGQGLAQEAVPLILTAESQPAVVAIGGQGQIVLHYDIDPGFHIGDVAAGFFKVEPVALPGLRFGEAVIPESEETPYGGQYAGVIDVTIPFTIGREALVGESQVKVTVTYQPCSEEGVCYPPEDVTLRVPVTVEPGQVSGGSISERLATALEKGSIVAFLLVFLGGFLTSFTPCVYPMIPITIAVIGAQAGGGRLKGFTLSLFYVLGLATMFTTLGVIAAKTGALFGSLAQNPVTLAVIGGIFFFMGLSMLGFYTVRVPSSIQTKLQGKRRSGFLGSYLTGVVAGVVVSPCVSPLLVVILTWVAKTGSLALGVGLLFSFALGLGVLFILIGTFSGVLKSLPKSGGWMEVVEHGFGILLVGLALFFVRPLFAPWMYKALWGAALVAFATFGGVFSALPEMATHKAKLGKALVVIVLVLGAGLLLSVVLPQAGPGEAASQPAAQTASGHELPAGWLASEVEGLAQARAESKPVMVDFWADWCTACHELDERTWPNGEVRAALEGFVKIKIDQTKNGEAEKALQKKYGIVGLPTVVFLSPEGEEVGRFEGYHPPEKVLGFIAEAQGKLK